MSRVVVNEIEAKVGNDVKFNSNIANPTTVQGEGTATTNLQQGLNKAWSNILYTDAAPGIQDSFNASSVADTTAGEYTVTLSNSMANSNYACVSNQQDFEYYIPYEIAKEPWLNKFTDLIANSLGFFVGLKIRKYYDSKNIK